MNYEERCRAARQRLHTTIYSQCYSPCSKYLALCTNYGHIAIVSLAAVLGPEATPESWKPFFTFQAQDHALFHLISTDTLLIGAGTDGIAAWTWKDVLARNPTKVWSLSIPFTQQLDLPEVNSMAIEIQDDNTKLYAGCGDNNVHVWDMESGQRLTQLEGHTDYIHTVALRSNSRDCISASEDGTVKMWDIRTPKSAVTTLEPFKNEECARPHLGRWIGCLAVDPADDWLVCGGGPHLSLWHLRSSAMTAVFNAQEVAHQHVMFYEDQVISGGTSPFVYHWSVNGELRSKVPCSPTSVFSIAINEDPHRNKAGVGQACHITLMEHECDIIRDRIRISHYRGGAQIVGLVQDYCITIANALEIQ